MYFFCRFARALSFTCAEFLNKSATFLKVSFQKCPHRSTAAEVTTALKPYDG